MNNKIVYGGVLVAIVLATISLLNGGKVGPQGPAGKDGQTYGVAAGTDFTESIFLRGGASIGSGCFATSTTGTLTATQLEKNNCIRIAAAGAGQAVLSLTLPASTTVSNLFPATGACRSWWVDASAVAAATTTTFVAGTGIDLVGLDATGAGTGADVIDGLESGTLTMCRQSDGDVTAFIEEWIAAD